MDALSDLPINVVDIGVLLILLISAVLAYACGFVHEVLSVWRMDWPQYLRTFLWLPLCKSHFARKVHLFRLSR